MGQVPRAFKAEIFDFMAKQKLVLTTVEPEYNKEKDCYQLPFYGYIKSLSFLSRATKASSRNFHVVNPEDPDSILLMHGKVSLFG